MSFYFQNYLSVLKNNFMLVIMASILLVLTFFIWAGFPFFIIGGVVADLTANFAFIHFCISLSGGILFSLFFVPINLKVAKSIANIKHCGVASSFVHIQTIWTLVCSIIFEIVMSIVLQL
ncbi:hypothetical protein LG329_16400 [Virgibacillus necropolis]|uniref:hypothetical protein n=1 Tax=Virgibacillus necropolis TaxID=163877 RepID=UPI00384E28BB